MQVELFLLILSTLFFASILAGKAGSRFGVPALLLFLGVGMLFGSDGLGIHFDNIKLAQMIGTVALSAIQAQYFCRMTQEPVARVEEPCVGATPMNKSNEVSNSLMKTVFTTLNFIQRCSVPLTGCPQEAEVPKAANTRKNRENVNEQLFVATERNAKPRYEGYKKLSEM